ncbi:MAG: pilus assembly protein PilM [Desulfobacterota bacterium]|nr:pilus assembly protein PilM [Thermodesulfobacteriota bacterium]
MVSLLGQKRLVGLDIGTSAVKLVELDVIKGAYRLKNFGMARLPRETIVNGVIINADPLVQAIKNLFRNLKITNKHVAVSISGHPVIIKKISLPFMTEDQLEPVIEKEAEQYIPFDLEEVNIDFQILGQNEETPEQMDVMLVAAKKALIEEYVEVLKNAGLQTRIIDIDVFALENMFNINYVPEEHEIVAIVDIGASVTNINILKNGTSIFNRDVFLGGNQITEELQKELSVSFEEAEMLKTGEQIEGIDHELLTQTIAKTSSSIAREIQRTLDFFIGTNYGRIDRVYLSGGASKTRGLKEIIEEKMNNNIVEFVDPFKAIKYDKKHFDSAYLKDIALFASIGVGLASRRFGD